MPSTAFTADLTTLLRDAEELDDAHAVLSSGAAAPQNMLDAINRAVVVTSVSAWECYVEKLVIEAVDAMHPVTGQLGAWSVHAAFVRAQAQRFHTPDPNNVRSLISQSVGLADVHQAWGLPDHTPGQTVQSLSDVLKLRHEIAHGINPRPTVAHHFSSGLPQFFRRLAQATDNAVRNQLVNTLAVPNPWPP